ncbi:hypothetical protein CDL15_Pgr024003 [Punica granatum]|uniref:Uncharacterized protein n=1 Tax=Punica granatum TaxID=22663 RepID=A0A218XV04_PUNGR|nr:hypothetical protein CDL15_Pgr024003 [Punica granatum]
MLWTPSESTKVIRIIPKRGLEVINEAVVVEVSAAPVEKVMGVDYWTLEGREAAVVEDWTLVVAGTALVEEAGRYKPLEEVEEVISYERERGGSQRRP